MGCVVYKRQLFFQYSRPSGCDTSKLLSDDLKNKLYYDCFQKVLYHYSHHADAEDLTMRTLKAAQINEDEYFGQILYDELAAILKQIKAAHGTDKTTSDGAAVEQARKQLENAQKFEGSPLEKKMNVLMGQIGIDYSKLTKEEQMTLLRVFNKSSMLKHRTKAGMRGKYRR